MNRRVLIILIAYLIIGVLLFPYFQYYVISDAMSYLDIAKKYSAGNFYDAINGIWGVLISWLSVPFLRLGIAPLLSFKILNFFIGGLTIFGFDRLSQKFSLSEKIRWLLLAITVPVVLSFVLVHTTSDLLAVCILIYYLNVVFNDNYGRNYWSGVNVGLLAGLGYLTKHYIFVFMAGHLLLVHLFHFFSQDDVAIKRRIVINLFISYGLFLLLSGSWIFILSNKYGFFTIGTSAAYNRAWMAPNSLGHAPEYLGLIPPSNSTANSMWEDLTYYTDLMPGNGWSPIDNWSNFKHQIKLVWQSLTETFLIFNKFSLGLGILIFLFGLINVLNKLKNREILSDKVFLSLVVIVLYSSGYLLIRTSDRYVWIDCFLLLLIGGLYLDQVCQWLSRARYGRILAVVTILLFSISFVFTPVRRFLINVNQDKWIYDLSVVLKERGIAGNIASNRNWTNTSILSWYLGAKYFGMPADNVTGEKLARQFNNYKIDYYLEWGEGDDVLVNKYPAVELGDLTIYKIK